MKIKSFMALLAAGLLCITSFSACDDDDDDSKKYSYELVAELTDPGSLSAAEIQENKAALNILANSYNSELSTMTLSPGDAKELLNKIVSEIKKALAGQPNPSTSAVTFTISMRNKSLAKVEFSETITIQPSK